jgi:hypothetical protein
MADEAFALSPISARAALPSEADYDAIRDAFMETSRGRWFLGEYAKRNRNADTSMVLDAVARIEEALAAQRQPPPPEDKLPEALQAIRNAVDEAALSASSALADLALEDNLAPVRKGARIIKEISWRWREIGADSRICDLIDSQLSAIEASCGQISEIDPRPEVGAAFDLIRDRIDGFDEADGQGAVDQHVPSPAAAEEAAVAAPVVAAEAKAPVAVDVMPDAPTRAAELTASEPEPIEADEPVEAPAIDAEAETAADRAEVDDDAILDMVAIEMAAPDETSDNDYFSAINDAVGTAAPALADPEAVDMPAPEEIRQPTLAPRQPQPIQAAFQPPAAAAAPVVQPSLGSTLLASGFLEQQRAPANDPLTPIRRMSQAERIAFFS